MPTKPNDPDWPAWLRFHLERCYEYRKIMADAVHEAHPGCMYTSNGGYRIKSARKGGSGRWDDPLTAPGYIGTLSQDVAAGGEPVGPMKKTRNFAMALSPEHDTPHDLMHQVGRGEHQISVPRLRQWAGLAMASGSAWFMFGSPGVVLNEATGNRVKALANFVHDRGDVLGRSDSRNPIAVLAGETSWERRNMDGKSGYYDAVTLENIPRAIQDGGFGVDIINEHILNSRARSYRVVVIPDTQREVSPRTAESLRAFVEAGGMLLVMGSGLMDGPGNDPGFENLLGLKRTGTAEGSHSLNIGGRTASFSSVWNVETSGAEVLAAYDNGKAFLTRHRVGEGSVAYVSFAGPIPYPDNDGVIAWTMDKLSISPWTRVTSGDEGKHLVYSFRSKPGRLYLHVVDLTSHMNGKRIDPDSHNAIDPVAVIPRLELSLKLPARPREVTVVPAASGVTHTWNNGTLNLTLTNVHYHAAVEMVLDGQFQAQYGKEGE